MLFTRLMECYEKDSLKEIEPYISEEVIVNVQRFKEQIHGKEEFLRFMNEFFLVDKVVAISFEFKASLGRCNRRDGKVHLCFIIQMTDQFSCYCKIFFMKVRKGKIIEIEMNEA